MFGKWTTGNQEILIVMAGSAACKSRLQGGIVDQVQGMIYWREAPARQALLQAAFER